VLPAFPIRRTIIVLCVVSVALGAALLRLAATADSAAAAEKPGELVLSSFTLEGANDYQIEVVEIREAGSPADTAIGASRGSANVSYALTGDLEPGIHGVFGDLGSVDLRFKRQRRAVDRPERGCRIVFEVGNFEGGFSFTGEGGYTHAAATSVRGLVMRLPDGFCGFPERRNTTQSGLRGDQLLARARLANGYVEVSAYRGSVLGTDLYATVHETLGPMSIERSLSSGRGTSFKLARGKPPRRAWAKPAKPFDGAARYIAPRGAPARWTGSLSASFPGLPAPVPLAGPSFAVRLCPDIALLKSCRVRLPKSGGSTQSSGSQSLARGVARLSWSR
jgi:hypothetical protein